MAKLIFGDKNDREKTFFTVPSFIVHSLWKKPCLFTFFFQASWIWLNLNCEKDYILKFSGGSFMWNVSFPFCSDSIYVEQVVYRQQTDF